MTITTSLINVLLVIIAWKRASFSFEKNKSGIQIFCMISGWTVIHTFGLSPTFVFPVGKLSLNEVNVNWINNVNYIARNWLIDLLRQFGRWALLGHGWSRRLSQRQKYQTLDPSIASAVELWVDNPLIVRRPSQMMQWERKPSRQLDDFFGMGWRKSCFRSLDFCEFELFKVTKFHNGF